MVYFKRPKYFTADARIGFSSFTSVTKCHYNILLSFHFQGNVYRDITGEGVLLNKYNFLSYNSKLTMRYLFVISYYYTHKKRKQKRACVHLREFVYLFSVTCLQQ